MATGATPQFGDGMSDPASLHDEASISPAMFDATISGPLTEFFRQAVARSAAARYDTAADMLAAWQAVFVPVPRTMPDDADASVAQAQPSTPLAQAGLSARALSALEPFGVSTVGDLVAVDPVRLNRMSGVADVTRREVKSRAAQWRRQFGAAVTGRSHATAEPLAAATLPEPASAAELLVEHAGTARAHSRRMLARLLLGLEPVVEPFATRNELSTALNVSAARTAQQVGALQDGWAAHAESRDLLDCAGRGRRPGAGQPRWGRDHQRACRRGPGRPGPVCRHSERAASASGCGRTAARRARPPSGARPGRRGRGRAVGRAGEAAGSSCWPATRRCSTRPRRSAGWRTTWSRSADSAGEPLVPAQRAAPRLQGTWTTATDGPDGSRQVPGADRLLRLAGALAEEAALSGSLELHSRDLPAAMALRLALSGAASVQQLTPQEIRDRFRARFPALPPLPDQPRLEQLISDAGLDLRYDDRRSAPTGTRPEARTQPGSARGPPRSSGRPRRNWSPAAGKATGWPRAPPPDPSSP